MQCVSMALHGIVVVMTQVTRVNTKQKLSTNSSKIESIYYPDKMIQPIKVFKSLSIRWGKKQVHNQTWKIGQP